MLEDERILRLTDAFMEGPGEKESCLELTVRVLNVNHGRNQELMAGCRKLEEYSCFVAKLKEYQKKYGSTKEAVDASVSYCIGHGILTDILIPLSAEVKKMLLTEYNEKKVMAWLKKEAREEDIALIREICDILKRHPEWSDSRVYEELKTVKQ
ncbi:MAG: hypothetical protein HFH88_00765 [Lachnospiraceae bacterium]|nr:hypothetical protein [Lachnospiraceae bacterium]